MSPEQVRGETVDARSDLFSFGILLCELLGGVNPFQRATPMDTMTAILRDPPRLPDHLPQGLMVVIRRLLAKPLAERYQSMKEVRTDLAKVTAEPVSCEVPAESRMPLIGRDNERAGLFRALDQAMA